MLTDYWVIALLFSELIAIFLLLPASWSSFRIIRYWDSSQSTPLQISLEKSTYLVSAILQIVLFFQIINLVMFLYTTNQHLPPLIKGAMCATGTLEVNDYGYTSLYLKISGVFWYAAFIMMNYWDNYSPTYPLTPKKYYLIIPILLWIVLDWLVMLAYFLHIEPDIIATCCSVNFSASGRNNYLFSKGGYLKEALIVFCSSFVIASLLWSFDRLKNKFSTSLLLFVNLVYVFSAVYSLKFFFVKYIYGLPTHTCLFDIFWIDYYYIGYWLFALYYLLLLSALFLMISIIFAKKIIQKKQLRKIYYLGFLALQTNFWTVILYWYFWQGNL